MPVLEAFQSVFLGLNKVTDWWMAIAVGTVGFRVALLPIQMIARRRRERLLKIQPLLEAWKNSGKSAGSVVDAGGSGTIAGIAGVVGNASQMRRTMLSREAQRLFRLHKCHPVGTLLLSISQFPLFVTVSAALRDLCAYPFPFLDTREFPAAGLDTQGILWFDNLLLPDPTLITPVALGCLHLVNASYVQSKPVKFIFQTLALASVPIATQVPMAIAIYWLVSALCSSIFNRMLQH